MRNRPGIMTLGKRVATDFSRKNVSFMAAGLAYNAFVSLAPLLLLLLLVVSIIGGGLEDRLIAAASASLPGPIADLVVRIFSGEAANTGVSVIGLVILIWGTLKIFRGLDTAFSEIYETERTNSFADQLGDGLVVLVALVVSIVATVSVSAVFATLSDALPLLGFVTPLMLIAGLIIAFFPMYHRFPDTDLGWKEVLPGTLFAAFGWAVLQAIFQVYLVFGGGGTGNFFGGILVVVTWLYFSGLVLLIGAVLNAVIGGHSTGSPGGVGRGAAQENNGSVTRTILTGKELASYLHGLRTQLTGHDAATEPATEATEPNRRLEIDTEVREIVGTPRRFRPILLSDGEVEVIEWSTADDGGRERTISLRWQATDHELSD